MRVARWFPLYGDLDRRREQEKRVAAVRALNDLSWPSEEIAQTPLSRLRLKIVSRPYTPLALQIHEKKDCPNLLGTPRQPIGEDMKV